MRKPYRDAPPADRHFNEWEIAGELQWVKTLPTKSGRLMVKLCVLQQTRGLHRVFTYPGLFEGLAEKALALKTGALVHLLGGFHNCRRFNLVSTQLVGLSLVELAEHPQVLPNRWWFDGKVACEPREDPHRGDRTGYQKIGVWGLASTQGGPGAGPVKSIIINPSFAREGAAAATLQGLAKGDRVFLSGRIVGLGGRSKGRRYLVQRAIVHERVAPMAAAAPSSSWLDTLVPI